MLLHRFRITSLLTRQAGLVEFAGNDIEQGQPVRILVLDHALAQIDPPQWARLRSQMLAESLLSEQGQFTGLVRVLAYFPNASGDDVLISHDPGGENLQALLLRKQPVEPLQAIVIARQTCTALRPLLTTGLNINRFSEANIRLAGGQVLLADIGSCLDTSTLAQLEHSQPDFNLPTLTSETHQAREHLLVQHIARICYHTVSGEAYSGQPLEGWPRALWAILRRSLGQPVPGYASLAELEHDLAALERQSFFGEISILLHDFGTKRAAALAGLALLAVVAVSAVMILPGIRSLASSITSPSPTGTTQSIKTQYLAWAQAPTSTTTPPAYANQTALPGDQYEPDDNNPAPISVGDLQSRVFWPAGDVDRVAFRVRAGWGYIIQTMNVSNQVQTAIEVLAGGKSLTSAPVLAGENAVVWFTASSDGTAIAIITNQGALLSPGGYTISLQEVQPALSPTAQVTATRTRENGNATITPRPTYTPGRTSVPALTRTPTVSRTPTLTRTPTSTRTPTPTRTPTMTRTPTPTRTDTPTRTPTETRTPTPQFTSTPSVRGTPPGSE